MGRKAREKWDRRLTPIPWTPFLPAIFPPEELARVGLKHQQEVYRNSRYQVVVRRNIKGQSFPAGWPAVIHLSIKRIDKEVIHDWRELQRIKNEIIGPEYDAVEIYPAESRLVDDANQYHIWVFSDPKFRLPFGFAERLVSEGNALGAKQRPFHVVDSKASAARLHSVNVRRVSLHGHKMEDFTTDDLLKLVGAMDDTMASISSVGQTVLRHCAERTNDLGAEKAAVRYFDICTRITLDRMGRGKTAALTRLYRAIHDTIGSSNVNQAPLDRLGIDERIVAKLQVLLTVMSFYKSDGNVSRLITRLASDRYIRWRQALASICASSRPLTLADIGKTAFGRDDSKSSKSTPCNAMKALTAAGLVERHEQGQTVAWDATSTGLRVHYAFASGTHPERNYPRKPAE